MVLKLLLLLRDRDEVEEGDSRDGDHVGLALGERNALVRKNDKK